MKLIKGHKTKHIPIHNEEDSRTLCERLFEVTSDLIDVLDRETELVRKSKVKDFTALNVRKKALTNTLTQDMNSFKNNIEFIKQTNPDQIQKLKQQQDQFHRSLEINHKVLSAMKAVTEQMLHTISTRVSQKKSGPEVYGKDAGLRQSGKSANAAISVDTSL
ncbi:MAG: hypothetical protein AAF228_00830 [Pseudomonadota bacterium]